MEVHYQLWHPEKMKKSGYGMPYFKQLSEEEI